MLLWLAKKPVVSGCSVAWMITRVISWMKRLIVRVSGQRPTVNLAYHMVLQSSATWKHVFVDDTLTLNAHVTSLNNLCALCPRASHGTYFNGHHLCLIHTSLKKITLHAATCMLILYWEPNWHIGSRI